MNRIRIAYVVYGDTCARSGDTVVINDGRAFAREDGFRPTAKKSRDSRAACEAGALVWRKEAPTYRVLQGYD